MDAVTPAAGTGTGSSIVADDASGAPAARDGGRKAMEETTRRAASPRIPSPRATEATFPWLTRTLSDSPIRTDNPSTFSLRRESRGTPQTVAAASRGGRRPESNLGGDRPSARPQRPRRSPAGPRRIPTAPLDGMNGEQNAWLLPIYEAPGDRGIGRGPGERGSRESMYKEMK